MDNLAMVLVETRLRIRLARAEFFQNFVENFFWKQSDRSKEISSV